ncbi:MAG TPA: GNA1162 family protein [Candidatus Binataceae bacterium]
MSTIRRGAIALLAGLLLILAGCAAVATNIAQGANDTVKGITRSSDLQTHAVRSIKTVSVNRVAVMPLIDAAPPGGEPLEVNAGEAVTAELYSQVSIAGGWEVIPSEDVERAMQKLPPTTPDNLDQNALQLAHDVSADGVLYGKVERYKERVGLDYAAASPAAVTFSLKFLDFKSKQIIWSAKFNKSQKALSQNIFDLANFVQHSARWVRAHEIALEGVTQAVADLHGNLNLEANSKHFEAGSYGELKSGQQRYSSGTQGMF